MPAIAIVPQLELFGWEEVESLGDLVRLRLALEHLPDEKLMVQLERERSKGRDEYPVRAMWNSIIAGVVFQHRTIEELRRELSRNAQLRNMCGFRGRVPTASAYSRFLKKLLRHGNLLESIFAELVRKVGERLPGFGRHLAMDSKAISSFAKGRNTNGTPDGRRDIDADYGKKTYRGIRQDGTFWEKTVTWFGYKLHLIVDATYELPVAYSVTQASTADINEANELLRYLEKEQRHILNEAETLAADKAYDDGKLIAKLWDKYGIKPVIDIRNMWKDGEETRLLTGRTNATYDYQGRVYCFCPETGTKREMSNGGFEKDRNTLKKLCPAKQYGIKCRGYAKCPIRQGIRIPLEEDRRIFTPIDRASYKWKREYARRTAVERVNSRLDVSFGFEVHTIRGLSKMKMRCGLALCVMLAIALGRIREKQLDKLRSFVAA